MKIKFLITIYFTLFLFGSQYLFAKKRTPKSDIVSMVKYNNVIRAKRYTGHRIRWSANLAKSAQKYAETLAKNNKFEHGSTQYGENLYASSANVGYTTAIKAWYSEKKYYNYASNSCTNDRVCGHYTQLIWKNTREVGCGKAIGRKWKTIIVCRYNPPGNYVGQRPY